MWRWLPTDCSSFQSAKISVIRILSSSATAVSKNHYTSIPQKSPLEWVSQNKLIQKHPRLRSLEEQCKSLDQLKQVLAYIFVSGLHKNPFVMSRVLYLSNITLEDKDGDLRNFGVLVFSQMDNPSVFSWNTMIRAFAVSNDSCDAAIAFQFYVEMLRRGILPDKYTFPFLLQACDSSSDLGLTEQVHCHAVVLGLVLDLFVQNALLNVYLVCCSLSGARELFDEMLERDVVSWTTLISGLVLLGCYVNSLCFFNRMLVDDSKVLPNVATVVSVMSACANLGSLEHTQCLHAYLEKAGWGEMDVSVSNSLMDSYAKCGSIDCAVKVFLGVHGIWRDTYSWTTLISGLAMHGRGKEAIALFLQMKEVAGVIPDAIVFVAVLSACAHAGLVEEGLQIFEFMEAEFGIVPELKHYGCMIDLFGRAGLLENAYDFVERMPMEPNLTILGSLLSACRVHNNMELGESVLKKIELYCENSGGAQVLLSNIYANENWWNKVIHIREEMRGGQKTQGKPPGVSWIEVKGLVHEFVVGDKTDAQTLEAYISLDRLGKSLSL